MNALGVVLLAGFCAVFGVTMLVILFALLFGSGNREYHE